MADRIKTVLITGASGYLGRFLCMDWLEHAARVGGKVICLIRAADATAARRRLERALGSDPLLAQRFRALAERHLAADRFTVADLCVASVLNWARPARELMAAHPLTHDWIRRCIERPAHLAAKALGGARIEMRPDSSRYLDLTILLGTAWRPPAETFHP